ncbi:MAG: rhodanese-like domain-containing protein [Burkholderiales bacterium]|nr:rhodanese-like domain-containing protein [Burkholderiales bacterium]
MHFITSNLPLVLAALGSGLMLLWPMAGKLFANFPEIETVEAVNLINRQDAIMLDVREHQEYASGHIPNAKHIPAAKVDERIGEIENLKDRPLIVYCRSGARSSSICVLLSKKGFGKVYNLKGGILSWEGAKLPVEK